MKMQKLLQGHVSKHEDEESLRKVISHQEAWRYCRKGAGEYQGQQFLHVSLKVAAVSLPVYFLVTDLHQAQ